jgi:hypothetical protein
MFPRAPPIGHATYFFSPIRDQAAKIPLAFKL